MISLQLSPLILVSFTPAGNFFSFNLGADAEADAI